MTVSFPEFVLLWQRAQDQPTPALHRRLARWFAARLAGGDRRLLLLAFRNSGKSTLLALLAVWLLLRDPEHRILVLAAEQALATKLSRFSRRVVERHPLCAPLRVAGNGVSWADDAFTVARSGTWRDPSLLARGVGGNITGAHADTVICDDVEVPNTAGSAARRQWLRERLAEIDHILTPGGLQVYAGTPHSFYSLYAAEARREIGEDRAFLHDFMRCVVPIVNAAGESNWPERFPVAAVESIRQRVGPNAFASQMLLLPQRPDAVRLDAGLMQRYADDVVITERNRQPVLTIGETQMVAASAWWDPAYGARSTGDFSVLAVVFVDADGSYWLHRVEYLSVDASSSVDPATQQCRAVASILNETHAPAVTLETNGIGGFLPGLLRQETSRQHVDVAVLSSASTTSKDRRILAALDALLAAGRIRAHESVWRSRLIQEFNEWRPGSGGHDDGLDAVSGAIAATPVRLPTAPRAAGRRWQPARPVQAAGDFPV